MKNFLKFAAALFFLPSIILAGPYPGSVKDHGHSGPGDGGLLTNITLQTITGSTGTFNYISVSTLTVSSFTSTNFSATNVTAATGTFTAIIGSTITMSSATFSAASAANFTSTGTVTLTTATISYSPSFLAYNNVAEIDVTGDGTNVDIDFDTEEYDTNSNFSRSTFTAPVNGRYIFSTTVTFDQTASGNTCELALVTTPRTYKSWVAPQSNHTMSNTWVVNLSQGNTAKIQAKCSGGLKVVDIEHTGGLTSGELTYFSGALIH